MPDLLARLQVEVERAPLHDFLRVRADGVGPDGAVTLRMPFRPEFNRARDSDGHHGGILAALIDLTAHAAVAVQTGGVAPTIDLRVDYLRAAPGVELRAIGRVLRLGGSIARADVEIWAGPERLVAVGRGTFQVLKQVQKQEQTA